MLQERQTIMWHEMIIHETFFLTLDDKDILITKYGDNTSHSITSPLQQGKNKS